MYRLLYILSIVGLLFVGGCSYDKGIDARSYVRRTYADCTGKDKLLLLVKTGTLTSSGRAILEIKCLERTYVVKCTVDIFTVADCTTITWFTKK